MVSTKFYATLLGGLLFVYIEAEDQQTCSTADAEPCLASRQHKYAKVMETYFDGNPETNTQFEEMGAQMCLTQIRNDADGNCFETNTELCALDQAKDMKMRWNELNRNITVMCEEVCPNFLQIATCKNLTVTKELKDSRFETFCRSFKNSLTCATNALQNCEFGISIYYSALEHQIMPYWQQICNSGCINIDETVGVIKTCAEPLKGLGGKPDKSALCNAHYNFKECVFGSNVVCKQVVDLIKFMYRKYFKVNAYCLTTTSTTTTPTTTTTTTTTATMTTSSSSSQPPSPTTDFTVTVKDMESSVVYSCISTESIEKLSTNDRLTVSTALDLMQLESCIYTNLSAANPGSIVTVSQHHIPSALRELFRSYKESGHQMLRDAMTAMATCAGSGKDKQNGCSGHSYGLIECEPSGAAPYKMDLLLKFLPVLIIRSICS